MGLDLIPADIRARFLVEERRHACAILAADFPDELKDIVGCLREFKLLRSEIQAGGGGKSKIARRFDDYLDTRGWTEQRIAVESYAVTSSRGARMLVGIMRHC
jgi:hypothetical protein